MKNNVTVILLMMFYYNINAVMLGVLVLVIYNIIDNYFCLDYICLFQYKLYKNGKNFEKNVSQFVWDGDT